MDVLGELPTEVSQRVLGFLGPADLFASARVSKTWRSRADSVALWKAHCVDRGWDDTGFVDSNRTHYTKSIAVQEDEGMLWPLNKWALTFQIRDKISQSWKEGHSIDYRLNPCDKEATLFSLDGQSLAIGHADGSVSILDVYRVPHLVSNMEGLLKGFRILALAISGQHLALIQSKLLQIYTVRNGRYDLVDAKSFELGFTQIEVLQRYNDTIESFVLWYSSEIGLDRYTKEALSETIHFEINSELIYVGVRDYQMVYVWSLENGRREDTIHIPNSTCKLRDLLFYDNILYIIYASRNIRHITAYETRQKRFLYEVTTPDVKTQNIYVGHYLVGVAISGPGLTTAGVLKVWEKDTGKLVASRHTGYVSFKTVSTIYDVIIYSERTMIYVWEPKNDTVIKTFSLDDPVVYLHPCPYRFVLVYTHGSCWLCDWLQGSKLYRLYPHLIKSGDYRGLVYSDETMLVMKADFSLVEMVAFC